MSTPYNRREVYELEMELCRRRSEIIDKLMKESNPTPSESSLKTNHEEINNI